MNKRTLRLLIDSLISIGLSVIIFMIMSHTVKQYSYLIVGYALIPLIWMALRHGIAASIITSAVTGIILTYIQSEAQHVASWLVPFIGVSVAGLFAKYTQKTLNNRRYSSTYLNITTASLLAILTTLLAKFVIIDPMLLGKDSVEWTSFGFQTAISWLIASLILIILSKISASLIIPKRSKYLSRKETSSLLND